MGVGGGGASHCPPQADAAKAIPACQSATQLSSHQPLGSPVCAVVDVQHGNVGHLHRARSRLAAPLALRGLALRLVEQLLDISEPARVGRGLCTGRKQGTLCHQDNAYFFDPCHAGYWLPAQHDMPQHSTAQPNRVPHLNPMPRAMVWQVSPHMKRPFGSATTRSASSSSACVKSCRGHCK